MAARTFGQPGAVPDIAFRRDGVVWLRARKIPRSHVRIAREAATRQHHAPPRHDLLGGTVVLDDHTGDLAVLDHEPGRTRGAPELDPAITRAREQACRERV